MPRMVGRSGLGLACVVGLSVLFSSAASAQERAPEACAMTAATTSYGPLAVGSVVTLQRHRFVRGDANWQDSMDRFLGRAARVTRLSGLDDRGCPGVRVDVDGGQHFWRIRDVGIGIEMQPLPQARESLASAFPQQCHQLEGAAQFGGATVGASVVLGRHRAVDGDTNWSEEMQAFVGRTARITMQASVDSTGCPGVRVDIDQQQWFWRIRDLTAAGLGGVASIDEPYEPSLGVTTDHGRPTVASTSIFGSGGIPGPQDCGLAEGSVVWGPISVGAQVTVGRHRDVNGDANWDAAMERYVGIAARIVELSGVDEQGCPVVRIDLDQRAFVWRVRDLTVTPSVGLSGIPRDCGMAVASYGSISVGSRVLLGRHTGWTGPDGHGGTVTGDADWADEMSPFVGRTARVVQLADLDPAGCPGVRVDIDSQQWFWRIRDMQPVP
jgi:hypothetical protein